MKDKRSSSIIEATMSEIAFVLVFVFLVGFTMQLWEQRKTAEYDDPGKAATDLPFIPDLSKLPVDMYNQLRDRANQIMGARQNEGCKLRVSNWTVQVLDGAISGPKEPECINGRLIYERYWHTNILFPIGSSQLTAIGQQCINASCEQIYAAWVQNRKSIEEILIKGHTSTDWKDPLVDCKISGITETNAFACNMRLSVQRAMAVWLQCFSHLSSNLKDFDKVNFSRVFRPVGRSSMDLVRSPSGCESPVMSRRVEFEVIAKIR